jgi:hypothetical protein
MKLFWHLVVVFGGLLGGIFGVSRIKTLNLRAFEAERISKDEWVLNDGTLDVVRFVLIGVAVIATVALIRSRARTRDSQ